MVSSKDYKTLRILRFLKKIFLQIYTKYSDDGWRKAYLSEQRKYLGMVNYVKQLVPAENGALAKLIIPFLIALSSVILFCTLADQATCTRYATVFGIYSFIPVGGPIAAVQVGLTLGISAVDLILFIVFTEVIQALFVVWNFDYTKEVPGIGTMVKRTVEKGEKMIERYKWVMKLEFLGLILLVTTPLQGTGAVAGSVIGRLMGMTPLRTWLAVTLGITFRTALTTLIVLGIISLL